MRRKIAARRAGLAPGEVFAVGEADGFGAALDPALQLPGRFRQVVVDGACSLELGQQVIVRGLCKLGWIVEQRKIKCFRIESGRQLAGRLRGAAAGSFHHKSGSHNESSGKCSTMIMRTRPCKRNRLAPLVHVGQ
jgi:hypothetical protein